MGYESIIMEQLLCTQNVIDSIDDVDYNDEFMLEYNSNIDDVKFNYTYDRTFESFETYLNDSSYIIEAVDPNKPGFFARIWNRIKQLWAWICKQFSRLVNLLLKLKPRKSVDQICEEVIKSVKQESYVVEADNSNSNQSTTVHFPASPDSVIKECDIHLAAKDLIIKIQNDQYAIISGNDPNWGNAAIPYDANGTHDISHAHRGVGIGDPKFKLRCTALFVDFVNDNHIMDLLTSALKTITTDQNGQHVLNDSIITTAAELDKIYINTAKITSINGSLPASTLSAVNQKLSEVQRLFQQIDSVNIQGTPNQLEQWKVFARFLERLTYGCNHLAQAINQIYMCDIKYLGTIKDIDELSTFVQALIQCGIPSKFVAFNTWIVMDHSLLGGEGHYNYGNYSRSNDNTTLNVSTTHPKDRTHLPRWGQTRVTFYPNGEGHVIKIAMNRAGMIGNKREIEVYNLYKKYGLEDDLARIEKYTKNYCILVSEKMKPNDGTLTQQEIDDIKNNLNKAYTQHPDLPKIQDLHEQNFGISLDGSEFKILDYGGR